MSETVLMNPFPEALVDARVVGKKISWYPETASTNTLALESGVDGAVFVAEYQTAGRGRHGRRWHSAPGLGLYFSVALWGPLRGVTFGAALAARDALSSGCAVAIRWPNDLCCGQRKIGGILVEQREGLLALGIGINVNQHMDDFPSCLRHRAGSLLMATGVVWDRRETFCQLLMHLDAVVQRLRTGEFDVIHAEWTDACNMIGKRVRRGAITGKVTAVDMEGALLLQTATGMKRVGCGDVTISDIE